jgi:hypothetical protein
MQYFPRLASSMWGVVVTGTNVIVCCLSHLENLINEGGYSKQQMFNVDETGFHCKRMPSRTFITKGERAASALRASKDRLTLLLGCNANGDFILKYLLV